MSSLSALSYRRRPGNQWPDERYKMLGLNMVMPDQLIINGESPYTINSRMYARESGDSRVAIRTRKGPGFYTIPVGETLDQQRTAVTGAAVAFFNNSTRQSVPFTAGASGPLTAVDLNLQSSSGIGTQLIEIRADNAGQPGVLLAISGNTGSSVVSAPGYVRTRFINPAIVTAGTQYWIIAYAQDDNTGFFGWTSTTSATNALTSINSGGTWSATTYSLNFKTYVSTPGAIKGWKRCYFSNGTKFTIFAHGTSLFVVNDLTGAPTAVKTGLNAAATLYRFEKFNDKMVVVNGYDQPFSIDSNQAIVTLANVPFIPNNVIEFKNYLFFTQTNDPTRYFWSNLADETTYNPVNFGYVPSPKSADPITGMVKFQGNLIFLTYEKKYILSGYDLQSFILREAIGTKGATSQEAITFDRNFVYFNADDGIYRWAGANDNLISDKVQPEVDGFADRNKPHVSLYNNQVRIYYPRPSQAQNNAMLLFDEVYNQWFMDTDAYCIYPGKFEQDNGNPLVEASSIYGALFYGEVAFSNLGAPLDFKYWTPYNKYISAMSKDRVHKFHPELRPGSLTYTMSIGKDVDFRNSPAMVPYVVASGGNIWGAAASIWGQSGINWGGNSYQDTAVAMSGRGKHTQYRFERYGANTPVEIYGYAALIKSSRLK